MAFMNKGGGAAGSRNIKENWRKNKLYLQITWGGWESVQVWDLIFWSDLLQGRFASSVGPQIWDLHVVLFLFTQSFYSLFSGGKKQGALKFRAEKIGWGACSKKWVRNMTLNGEKSDVLPPCIRLVGHGCSMATWNQKIIDIREQLRNHNL